MPLLLHIKEHQTLHLVTEVGYGKKGTVDSKCSTIEMKIVAKGLVIFASLISCANTKMPEN